MAIDPVIVTLTAALGGAVIGFVGGFINNAQKRSWDVKDADKKRIFQKEDEQALEEKRTKDQKFEMYNRILMKTGDSLVVTAGSTVLYGGRGLAFDFNLYSENIRPLLFERLHVIDKDVRELIQKIDKDIARVAFHEEATDEEEDSIASSYNRMITLIEDKYMSQ